MNISQSYLRTLNPETDGVALHEIFGDEKSCRYLPNPATSSIAETVAQLVAWDASHLETCWVIVEDRDGPALGRISFIPRKEKVWEAAVMLTPSAQGKGLATRALSEAITIMFENQGARRLYADIDPDHTASLALFDRLGFQKEGYFREEWETHIGVRDAVMLALLRTDPRPTISA